jgi:excisionase family DNA binding protein
MLTVPEAARRTGRNPQTIRRWIRAGKLRSQRVGTQHLIDENDLDEFLEADSEMGPLPDYLQRTASGAPMPNVVRWIHEIRRGR